MPYAVRDLVKELELKPPVTATPEDTLRDVLKKMIDHDYSQLPVVIKSGVSMKYRLVTRGSILRALKNLALPPNEERLRVGNAHVLVDVAKVYTMDDTIFALTEGMEKSEVALVVEESGELAHIITLYDTTLYFRRWAEDLMHARDVEHMLRRFINESFKWSDGTLDEAGRRLAISGAGTDDEDEDGSQTYKRMTDALRAYLAHCATSLTSLDTSAQHRAFAVLYKEDPPPVTPNPARDMDPSAASACMAAAPAADPPSSKARSMATDLSGVQRLNRKFTAALKEYLQLTTTETQEPDSQGIGKAVAAYRGPRDKGRDFSELSLGSYVDIFLRQSSWARCCRAIGLDLKTLRNALENVKRIRNLLAHFRDEEITSEHRELLRWFASWLAQQEAEVVAEFRRTSPMPPTEAS